MWLRDTQVIFPPSETPPAEQGPSLLPYLQGTYLSFPKLER